MSIIIYKYILETMIPDPSSTEELEVLGAI